MKCTIYVGIIIYNERYIIHLKFIDILTYKYSLSLYFLYFSFLNMAQKNTVLQF